MARTAAGSEKMRSGARRQAGRPWEDGGSRAVRGHGKAGNMPEGEDGVCILCGREVRGIPARADMAIRAARKMREMLGMEPRHTVACADCFHLCREKRLSFEKSVKKWRIGAAAFVLLLLCGALFYGRLEPWLAAPALAGAALMLLVPYGNYFPAFEGAEKN